MYIRLLKWDGRTDGLLCSVKMKVAHALWPVCASVVNVQINPQLRNLISTFFFFRLSCLSLKFLVCITFRHFRRHTDSHCLLFVASHATQCWREYIGRHGYIRNVHVIFDQSIQSLTLKQDVFGAVRFIPIPLPQGTHWDMLPVLQSYWKLFLLCNEVTRFPGLPVASVRSVSSSARLLSSILHLKGIKTCKTGTESAARFRIAQTKVTTALSLTRFSNRRPVEKVDILDD